MKSLMFILSLFLLACASKKSVSSAQLDALLSQKHYTVQSYAALPQVTSAMNSIANAGLLPPGSTVGRIDIVGSVNYLKVLGDSISGYLPYFGESQGGNAYRNTDMAIQFDGIPSNFEQKKGKKGSQVLSFSLHDKNNRNELYDITLEIFPNLSATIGINSTQRFFIRYRGTASKNE